MSLGSGTSDFQATGQRHSLEKILISSIFVRRFNIPDGENLHSHVTKPDRITGSLAHWPTGSLAHWLTGPLAHSPSPTSLSLDYIPILYMRPRHDISRLRSENYPGTARYDKGNFTEITVTLKPKRADRRRTSFIDLALLMPFSGYSCENGRNGVLLSRIEGLDHYDGGYHLYAIFTRRPRTCEGILTARHGPETLFQ
jgi:hypothetical protein